jgi:hypothetical protein
MKCPDCGFENIGGEERCFRCRAFLGQVGGEELAPPRRRKDPLPSMAYDFSVVLRKFYRRLRLDQTAENTARVFFLVPVTASFLIPGLGQVLNRRYLKAFFFFFSYLIVLAWHYFNIFRGGYLPGLMVPVFFICLGNSPYILVMLHTWIVFDAYIDAVRRREPRIIGIWESVAVSLVISLLVVSLLNLPRQSAESRLAVYRLMNVPNLAPFSILDGDVLIMALDYYDRHPVLPGQIVANCGVDLIRIGGETIAGQRIPGVILGLPGDIIRFRKNGVFLGSRRLSRIPPNWWAASGDCEFTVPPDRYFVLPANFFGDYPGAEKLCLARKELGGKYVFLFLPEARRQILP